MGWLITLGILAVLAILPLGVSAIYDRSGPLVRLILGPVRLTVYPMKKKDKPQKEKKETPPEEQKQTTAKKTPDAKTAQVPQKKKQGGPVTDFLPLVNLVFDFLGDLRRKLRVNVLELKLILAGDDPADLGINYGRAWAALGNLMPRLESLFVIKKRDLEVECDFTADKTLIFARLDLTITLGRLLWLIVCYGVRCAAELIKILNKRKGGAKT